MKNSQFEPLPVIQWEEEYPEMQDRKWKRYTREEFNATMWVSGIVGYILGLFTMGFVVTNIL